MKGKYEKQLRHVFFSIAAIFIIASSFSLASMLRSQYRKTVQQTVNSENLLANVSISTVHSVLTNLQQNTSINSWGTSSTKVDYYYEAIQVMNDLNTLRMTFSAIPFFPAVTRLEQNCHVISSYGTSSKKEYFKGESTLSQEQADYILSYFSNNTGELVMPVYSEKHSLSDLYYVLRKPYSRSNLVYFLRLPKSSLMGDKNENHFILYNDTGIIAYSSNEPSMVVKFEECYQQILNSDITYTTTVSTPIHYGQFDIYVSSFDKSNWKIAYIDNTSDISVAKIAASISIPVFLMCLLFYIIFHFISNWLYRPIRDVLEEMRPHKGRESLDEFDLFKQKAITSKKLAENLKIVMDENISLISQKFYRDLVLGVNVTENPLYEALKQDQENYCIGLFEFQDDENEALSNDMFFSKNALISCAHQRSNIIAININHTDCALIIQAVSIDEAKELIQSINNDFSGLHEYKVSLSSVRSGIQNIHTCYQEACHILEYKYLYLANTILTTSQVQEYNNDNYHYPIIMENRLIQALAEGRNTSMDIFDSLIRENFSNRSLTPETLRSFIYSLLGTVNRAFQELKTSPLELLTHNIDYETYYAHWNNPNIIRSIRKMLLEILEAVKNRNHNSDNQTLEAMKTYVYENFSRDITLNDMADTLDISAKYSSNLFKKLSNDTFKNFLNHYRIDQAKNIIEKNANIKISDLSLMVGFNSSNTFIRVFGKYTGMTPGAYASSIHNCK